MSQISVSVGTSHWYEDYPICSQDRQSPIDFPQVEDMHYDSQLVPFRFTGFDDVSSYGLTLLHIVNYNEKYGDLSNAASKERDGLAVLGFWFEVATKDNDALLPLIEQLSHVKTHGSSVVLSGVNLGQLLPIHDDYIESHYFRYSGSLTTPPCFQSVIWTVFHHPVPISEQQLQMFRALHEDQQPDSEHYLINNFRPVQPLNGRVISRNFQPQSKDTTVDTPSVTTTKPKRDLKINFRMLKLWSKHYQI
uniref:carbonic anhydrase n=1 Tax=Magallana gigas TaxID=29159 RepID=K1QNU1_MAGGI